MFLNFEIGNYRSIGDSTKIDFCISNGQQLGAFAILKNQAINKIACLVGPNASGKSNILRGIEHFLKYMCHSYANPKLRMMRIMPHFCYTSKPTSFSVEFAEKNDQYKYDISLLDNVVQQESLKRLNTKTKRYKSIFVRELNKVKQLDMGNIEINKTDLKRLTEDISLFSLLLWSNYWGDEKFFKLKNNVMTNINLEYWSPSNVNPLNRVYDMERNLRLNKTLLKDLIEELNVIDTGISELRFGKVQEIRRNRTIRETIERETSTLIALHNINEKNYPLHFWEESAGTINYMELYINLYSILRNGGILIADELEQSLHPDITMRILDKFLDKNQNPNNAQLLFTTHNPWFLQDLTKTQIHIIEKNGRGETDVTRLDEIKGVRNDENYFIKYIDGEYDGKPRIKER